MLLLLISACTPPGPAAPSDDTGARPAQPPSWDLPGPDDACTSGASAPLLEAALADGELDRKLFGYLPSEWDDWRSINRDDFEFSWWAGVHHTPEQTPCFGRQLVGDLDVAAASVHPVAAILGGWAPWLDIALDGEPIDAAGWEAQAALDTLTSVAGGAGCSVDGLDPALAHELVPVFLALAEVVATRVTLDASAADHYSTKDLYNGAPSTVLYGKTPVPDVADGSALNWFSRWFTGAEGPKSLMNPARRLAFAVEDAGLEQFAGTNSDWSCTTDRGGLRVSPSSDDAHTIDEGNLLFHLELGGDDTYTGPAGATADKDQTVALLVDLDGADTYTYDDVPSSRDAPGVLPSDDDSRGNAGGYWISLSDHPRQGAGRYGVGMLFDRGGDDDHYTSLRMSQGFGAFGVGVLADDGGNDVYAAEAGAQGAGVFGWGLLLDRDGNDNYRTWAQSQGFAYVHSGGMGYDGGGDDVWWADPGRDYGGLTLYYSPQLASGQGNSSFSQGAGFGMRDDADGVYLSGGLGMLRDRAGADTYTAGVFAQATGYWKGTGVLADGEGNDSYDALWYIQGGAAHFALALLLEGAGDDQYNPNFVPYNVSLGSGHDFSVGVAIDESGSDTIRSTSLGLGASNCQGIGVWVDNAGDDTYIETSTYSVGLGNQSTECNAATGRTDYRSIGMFIDADGADAWQWVGGDGRTPGNDSSFGFEATGTPDEHGGAVDGTGESGFRLTPS